MEIFKMFIYTILCVRALILGVNSATAPFIKPCRVEDAACLFESGKAALPYIAAGIPSLGVPSADPMFLDEVQVDNGWLKLGFRNSTVLGISNCNMTNLETSGARSYRVVLECPIVATGQYLYDGILLVIPVEVNGDFEIKTDNIRISVEFVTEDVIDAAGEKHWKIASYQSSYEPLEKFYIRLDKLFNGEKQAKEVLKILDHTLEDLVTEIGKPIIQEIVKNIINAIEKFFEGTALDELIIQ